LHGSFMVNGWCDQRCNWGDQRERQGREILTQNRSGGAVKPRRWSDCLLPNSAAIDTVLRSYRCLH
jgi:hypothetical protein